MKWFLDNCMELEWATEVPFFKEKLNGLFIGGTQHARHCPTSPAGAVGELHGGVLSMVWLHERQVAHPEHTQVKSVMLPYLYHEGEENEFYFSHKTDNQTKK
jgi:hypothetical protein